MASKTKTITSFAPSFVDFEPYCEWQNEEKTETLVLHLPDFKKDQLRVQVNNQGVLKVSGERPLDATHRSRFLKETKTPQGCNINDIRAKFMNGHLHVIMPKKVQPAAQADQLGDQPASTSSAIAQDMKSEVTQEPKSKVLSSYDKKLKGPSTGSGKIGTSVASDDQPKDQMFGFGSSLARVQVGTKTAVGFGFAVVAFVAIGAYAVYKCGSDAAASSSGSGSSSSSGSSSTSGSAQIKGRD